ncbi:MAG: bifunctional 5,10-methylenetetrahydrofolate dehydrogenase/5,10-methenyltetrahydrofolate cyclohydrolase [Minisyncoccia bacterium]|jgi:methylenetetrahydrofolate dehydrogenase (NADP+)/methenyltetrahydrofolate cyclohydrolase
MVIDGRKIAAEIADHLKALPKPDKFLAGVLVGNDPASKSFQKIKHDTAARLGIDYRIYEFSENLTNDALREEVGKIAAHKTCGGVVVQLPLPDHFNWYAVLNAIPPEKDPDLLSERSLGAFYNGRTRIVQPAAEVVAEILKRVQFDLKGKKVVVVGRGFLIGKPISLWLLGQRAGDVTVVGKDSDYSALCTADLVITGVGKAGLVTPAMLKPGAGVIDFGYQGGKGDFDPGAAGVSADEGGSDNGKDKIAFYTPTPGGTGPILVAKLLENFYTLNS